MNLTETIEHLKACITNQTLLGRGLTTPTASDPFSPYAFALFIETEVIPRLEKMAPTVDVKAALERGREAKEPR